MKIKEKSEAAATDCNKEVEGKANVLKKKEAEKKKAVRKKGDDVKKALIKKAMGYDAAEITEEYCVGENGEVALSKRKVIKKNVPPDVAAIKYLLECDGGFEKDVSEMTEEELLKERERLLRELKDAV